MSLDELIRYNKLVYGVEPKINTVPYTTGYYRFVYGEVRNRILYIPIDAPGSTVNCLCTFEDGTTFSRAYYFSKIINLFYLRVDVNTSKKIISTRINVALFAGISAFIQSIPQGTDFLKDNNGNIINLIELKQLSSLSNNLQSYNLAPWYLLEYDEKVKIW